MTKSRKKLLICPAVLVCLTALDLYGNPFPAKAEPSCVQCSMMGQASHTELTGEAADAAIGAFHTLRLSWFPEPKKLPHYFPQPEKQYFNLVLGKATFVHLSVREDDSVYAYVSPWGGRTYKVLNPKLLAPLVPMLNELCPVS